MSKKKMGSKMMDSLRQAREATSAPATPERAPAPPVKTATAPAKSAPAPAARAPAKRSAAQDDQVPAGTLDHPWDNLHPRRIWPD